MPPLPELEVRVGKSGDHYTWGLHYPGCNDPIRFSVPKYASEYAARTAGEKVLRISIRNREIQNARDNAKPSHPLEC